MNRLVEPEMLETLAEDDPGAIQSRKDLLLVNGIMGNHRWIMRELRQRIRPGWRVLELGAGDGALSQKLIQRGICQPAQISALDLASRPTDWPAEAAWHQRDLFAETLPDAEVIIANLFLHHFEEAQLAELGKRLPSTARLILAAEPARYRFHQIQGGLFCRLMRLHFVTRNDMMISIRAGFRGDELSQALGLDPEWTSTSRCGAFGAYQWEAIRDASSSLAESDMRQAGLVR